MLKIDNKLFEKLREAAIKASKNAYAPYSKFRVGAALSDEKGNIFSGANVENVSYGLTICAERSAIFSGISNGINSITVMVIYTPTEAPTPPCGACRQVIREFSKDAVIISVCDTDEIIETSINELLPNSFNEQNIEGY